jgi:hypothetical protein
MAINTKLTETRIDVGDRHTTLNHFVGAKSDLPFYLGEPERYEDLYWKIAMLLGDSYWNLAEGRASVVLDRLRPVYSGTKYWRRYLATDPIPQLVWREALPLEATIKPRISLISPNFFKAKASPLPRVLVYPFGWSTCISIRIIGEHTLPQLADFLNHLFEGEAFELPDSVRPMNLRRLFTVVSSGVRDDAFAGTKTQSVDAQQIALVVTIMAKHGGSPALGALSSEDEDILKKIVRPEGANSHRKLGEMLHRFDPRSDVEFMVIDRFARLIWMEHLLVPQARNRQLLNCYHNNSFTALVQAWHLMGLTDACNGLRQKPKSLQTLLETALERLRNPRFLNASLKGFLELDNLKNVLSQASGAKRKSR